MPTNALGPTFAGGMQPISEKGFDILFYPDVNNNALQAEGKPPVFYWLPNYVHIARKDGKADGDLMFSMIRFAGRESQDGSTDLGEGKTNSVAGGVLGFSVTSAPPDEVLKDAQQQIVNMWTGKTDHFWGIRTNMAPVFRPVPIVANDTMVSNLSPQANGSSSTPVSDLNANANSNPVPGVEPPRGHAKPLITRFFKFQEGDRVPDAQRSNPVPQLNGYASIRSVINSDRFLERMSEKIVLNRDIPRLLPQRGPIDPWYWNMQGAGKGSVDPSGVNAYTAMIGAYPAAIVWEAFHRTYTPIFVNYLMKVKFWTPQIEVTIKGNWDRVFEHFSANANGRYYWFSADLKAEINNMRTNGSIEVDIKVDGTIPNGEKVVEQIEKRSDLVFEKFMEMAKKVIFDPPQPTVEAASANNGLLSGILPYGGGLALKYRRDSTKLNLYYHETRQIAYLQEVPISGSLEGVYDEIKANPDAEKKYFMTIDLNDWPQKLARITKPVVDYNAMPVAFLSVQHGYPNTKGEVNWLPKTFDKSDPDTATGIFEFTQKQADQVTNPPQNWKPDMTFLKRRVHMKEEANPFTNIYERIQIRDNVIDLDPGPNGTMINDTTVEVRADDAGRLRVGPIGLGVELENSKQVVEVTFQLTDEQSNDLQDYEPVKFTWKFDDQETSRYWAVYTQDNAVRPFFKYQVRVIVKGTLTTKGMEWAGPWVNSLANGPLMITVPTPEDRDVVLIRSVQMQEMSEGQTDHENVSPPEGPLAVTPPTSARNEDNPISPLFPPPAESREMLKTERTIIDLK